MSKRFSVDAWLPALGRFALVVIRVDILPRADDLRLPGWVAVTVELLGFGVSLTYWRHPKQPDVYGDGGVA